jgi:Zn-finger nucleic acid-binding protein
MARAVLDGNYGSRVELDVCHACAALWFDGMESLALTPGAILRLFAVIHEDRAQARSPLRNALGCPRCRARLVPTADVQRGTRFSYWRCPGEHGRLIAFLDFLREKNFIRPLSPRELSALRRNVRTLTCSGCGAPVDLERDVACRYCHAPISVLDAAQVEKVVEELRRAEAERQAPPPADLPFRLLADKRHVERFYDRLRQEPEWGGVGDSFGLLEGGLAAVAGLLRGF